MSTCGFGISVAKVVSQSPMYISPCRSVWKFPLDTEIMFMSLQFPSMGQAFGLRQL